MKQAETKYPHPNLLPGGEGTNPPLPLGEGGGEGAISIKISFYGAFRKYGDHETLNLPQGSSAADLKDLLAQHLSGKIPGFADGQLIKDSAVACNDSIVDSSHKVQADDVVAILPPVCGG